MKEELKPKEGDFVRLLKRENPKCNEYGYITEIDEDGDYLIATWCEGGHITLKWIEYEKEFVLATYEEILRKLTWSNCLYRYFKQGVMIFNDFDGIKEE